MIRTGVRALTAAIAALARSRAAPAPSTCNPDTQLSVNACDIERRPIHIQLLDIAQWKRLLLTLGQLRDGAEVLTFAGTTNATVTAGQTTTVSFAQ